NSLPSQPSRPNFVHEAFFGEDEIRSLVRDALGQIPSDSRVVGDSMFEDNVGESSQISHRRVEGENVGIRSLVQDALGQIPSDNRVAGDSMFKDNVGESSQSSHRRVEDENVGESSKSSNDSATYKKLLEECDKELYPGCNKDMRWHNMGRTMDGKLRHPADGLVWKGFDARYSDFASDPRSVRHGLASDGVNPFRTMSTTHSTWPVLLIPYNLPPWLCAKVLDPDELDKVESEIALTLCEMEKLLPPSFFTIMVIMVHLTIHLISEAKLGGPVHYRWMYPIERYFEGAETRFNRPPRNDEHILEKEMYILNSGGRKLGKVSYLEKIKFDEEVLSIATGPRTIAEQYNGIIMNGYRFLTRRRKEFKKTQHSGVFVEVGGGNYYGKLSNIIELEYFGGYKVVLFQCDWVDIRPSRGLKKDRYGCPLVNFSRPLIHTGKKLQDDPFIISSQARQVFYMDDLKDAGWSHVIVAFPRDMFNMRNKVIRDDDESYTQCIPYNLPTLYDVNEAPSWHRKDIEIKDDE
nr:hypothetical protein [Tanacetum cinerariifolium]